MKTIAFINHKGGVGKTTTCTTFGALLASHGLRTLLVDIDSQCSLTASLLKDKQKCTIADTFGDGCGYASVNVAPCLDVVPSSLAMAGAEQELNAMPLEKAIKVMASDLKPMQNNYDVCLIDCPPSFGRVLHSAIACADYCVLVTIPEALPFKGVATMIDLCKHMGKDDAHISILANMVQRNALHDVVVKMLADTYGDMMCATTIRKAIAVASAPLTHQTIIDVAPNSKASQDFKQAFKELTYKWNIKTK